MKKDFVECLVLGIGGAILTHDYLYWMCGALILFGLSCWERFIVEDAEKRLEAQKRQYLLAIAQLIDRKSDSSANGAESSTGANPSSTVKET